MIYNLELEKQLLAALIKEPDSYSEVANFISAQDFYSGASNLHSTIFALVKQSIDKGENVDEVIIAQRAAALNLSFEDRVNPSDYICALAMRKVPEGNLLKTAKELKKYTIRREIYESAQDVARKMKAVSPEETYSEIIEKADKSYNARINLYETGEDSPENIYDDMEALIEERGDNPISDFGLLGPHKKLNEIYGSLLRAGNITVIVARSAVGKTSFVLDYVTKVSLKHDTPVLHFDNGEMSKEELIMRQCAALSGVKLHLLETGQWRRAGQKVVDRVRAVWPQVKKLKFYYYNVGGMDVDAMIKTLKRFYYGKIGRGNQMIFSFDYIKTTSESSSNKNEWQIVGEMVDKFKRCIQKEITQDGKPLIPMMTSVQSNRTGIVTNRNSQDIIDNESIVSLSDRIIHFASHMFILRKKTMDEIAEEGPSFGTHKFIEIKARHLGEDIAGALEPVQIGDALKKNFINLDFQNFSITEKGDLRDIARYLDGSVSVTLNHDEDDAPDFG